MVLIAKAIPLTSMIKMIIAMKRAMKGLLLRVSTADSLMAIRFTSKLHTMLGECKKLMI